MKEMNGDHQQEAHKRLLAKLTVRTHIIRDSEELSCGARRVEVSGIVYPSLRQAAKANGISISTIVKWVDIGKANYVA